MRLEKRPETCFNPPVLKNGESNLQIGKVYLMFWRSEKGQIYFGQRGALLILEINKTPKNPQEVENLIEFKWLELASNNVEKYSLGSNEDMEMFYFEEIV